MCGLKVGRLSWCLEFPTLCGKFGFGENGDPTVHHQLESDGSLTLVLVYVEYMGKRGYWTKEQNKS